MSTSTFLLPNSREMATPQAKASGMSRRKPSNLTTGGVLRAESGATFGDGPITSPDHPDFIAACKELENELPRYVRPWLDYDNVRDLFQTAVLCAIIYMSMETPIWQPRTFLRQVFRNLISNFLRDRRDTTGMCQQWIECIAESSDCTRDEIENIEHGRWLIRQLSGLDEDSIEEFNSEAQSLRERRAEINKKIADLLLEFLSPKEERIMFLWMNEMATRDIAFWMDYKLSSIHATIDRVKKKLRQIAARHGCEIYVPNERSPKRSGKKIKRKPKTRSGRSTAPVLDRRLLLPPTEKG